MPVSCQHLSQLLQSWNFGNQFQQPCLGFCIKREFDLLSEFWGQARSRESRQHESHGIVNQWTPSHINLGNQGFCRQKLQNPFRKLVSKPLAVTRREDCLNRLGSFSGTDGRREAETTAAPARCFGQAL